MPQPARLFVLGSFVQACSAEVERLPRPGECLSATRFTAEPGGKGFNVAAAARRQGAEVDCLVAIGEDPFGALAEAAFDVAGLRPHLIRRYPVPTGAGVATIGPDGETMVAVFSGANMSLSVEDVRAAAVAVAGSSVVSAQFEIAEPPIVEAFAIARAAGRETLLNPSPFHPPSDALLAVTSVVVVNESEARDLASGIGCGDEPTTPEGAKRLGAALFARGVDLLIVTRGAQGAIACERGRDELVVQPAFRVAAVDTLGAGDAFVAAFAVSRAQGGDLAGSLRRGAAAGAVIASRKGVFGAFPTASEIDDLAVP